jgi:hypothetical protein
MNEPIVTPLVYPQDSGKKPPKRRDIKIHSVFDIETQDWTTFVAGGVLRAADQQYEAYSWRQEDDYADKLLAIEGDLWAHNMGGFDGKWLLNHIRKRGLKAQIACAGAKLVSIRCGQLRVLDSKALTKLSLEELTQGMDVKKEKLALPCTCDENCGGYCSIRRDMPQAHWERMLDYLRADCVSLYRALQEIREYAAQPEIDLDLGATVGGCAWRNAQRLLGLPNADFSRSMASFLRQAYFGGRVQLFKAFSSRGFETDVSSMYPSRLAYCPIPIGDCRRLTSSAADAFWTGKPGIYRARVNVPESHIPPLPFRMKDRVAYPWGSFEGTWTAPELRYATEAGCTAEVLEGVVWEREEIVFAPWVDRLFKLRAGAGKKSPIGIWLKFYLNSLTGKLGTKPEHARYALNLSDAELGDCPGTDDCYDYCTGACGTYKPMGGVMEYQGKEIIWGIPECHERPEYRLDPCAHVEWAAYLTSLARIKWHRHAISINDGLDVVYGDTDSIFSEVERPCDCGNPECTRDGLLGHWEATGAYRDFEGFAPKLYVFKRDEKLKVKAKGLRLPRDPEIAAQKIRERSPVGGKRVLGFKAAIAAGNFFTAENQTRRAGQGFGDRLPSYSGASRAPHILELVESGGEVAWQP